MTISSTKLSKHRFKAIEIFNDCINIKHSISPIEATVILMDTTTGRVKLVSRYNMTNKIESTHRVIHTFSQVDQCLDTNREDFSIMISKFDRYAAAINPDFQGEIKS